MKVRGTISPGNWKELLEDGATVAIGGAGLNRKPMGLVRDLAKSEVVDLSIVSFLGSVDVELLLATGVCAEINTAGTALDGMGLAPRYRTARQEGHLTVVEWSEGSLAAALEAASLGLGSMPCTTSPTSEVVSVNPHLRVDMDPFSNRPTVFARALTPDLGLIQVSAVDSEGNLHVDGDPAIDALVAKAARSTVASALAEEDRDPRHAAISRIWVDTVMIDPHGAWPTACHPGPPADLGVLAEWSSSGGSDPTLLTEVPS